MIGVSEELITTEQLCKWLKISKSTASRWKSEGLPCQGSIGNLRYKKSEVLEWLRKHSLTIDSCSDNLITEKKLVNWLNITLVTAWRWRKEGLPYLGRKKSIRYNKKQVVHWLIDKERW